jgi:hypothetical protein
MNRIIYLVLIFVVMMGVACQRQPALAPETVSAATIKAGDPIPAPAEAVILSLSGPDNKEVTLDLPTLEKVGLVKYTVTDPWLESQITYTGVLLSDLLKVAGVADDATTVKVVALDDYAADIPIEEINKWPILIATQADGEYLTIENNGPTRIIFPYDTYPDITAARNMSVWNLEGLEIK